MARVNVKIEFDIDVDFEFTEEIRVRLESEVLEVITDNFNDENNFKLDKLRIDKRD